MFCQTLRRSMPNKTLRLVLAIGLAVVGAPGQVLDLYDVNAYRDIYLDFSQPNYWAQLLANKPAEINLPADMTVDGVTYPNVGVRFRGNTSFSQLPVGSEKFSFNIETDAFISGQELLGYHHLNLNNGFHDPTFLREFLNYYICRRHGIASGCNFVRLFLNGQYWGVYINVQQPNKDLMGAWLDSRDGSRYRGYPTTGSFSNGRCAFTWLGNSVADYLSAYQAKEGDGVDLMLMCDILNNTPGGLIPQALPAVFNVDQFYRYAACMNIVTQTDSYIGTGKDHFVFQDARHGDFHVIPFDLNEGFSQAVSISPLYNTANPLRPAFSQTTPVSEWQERYEAHYRTILAETFNWNHLGPIVNQFYNMIAADVIADTKKIYSTADFQQNLNSSVVIPGGSSPGSFVTVPGLTSFIQNREAALSVQAVVTETTASLSLLSITPALPAPGQTVTITVQASPNAASVSLWTRRIGPFQESPMFDDGAHGDGAAGDGTFGIQLSNLPPGSVTEYYAAAQTSTGTTTYLPRNAELNAPTFLVAWPIGSSPVRINEFLAVNNSVITDPAGEFEDYVELFNTSTQALSVGGHYLTDDLTNPTKWQIPSGTTILGRGTLLIWCDEDGTQGPLHTNFKLGGSGEDILFFAPDGVTLLDGFRFGLQQADWATGRVQDGSFPWVTLLNPSPDQPNLTSSCGVVGYTAQNPLDHDLGLTVTGTPSVGGSSAAQIFNGAPGAQGLFLISNAPSHSNVGATAHALVDVTVAVGFSVTLDSTGSTSITLPIPNDPALVGQTFYVQAGTLQAGVPHASPAYAVTICP